VIVEGGGHRPGFPPLPIDLRPTFHQDGRSCRVAGFVLRGFCQKRYARLPLFGFPFYLTSPFLFCFEVKSLPV